MSTRLGAVAVVVLAGCSAGPGTMNLPDGGGPDAGTMRMPPPPGWKPEGARVTFSGVSFIAPAGMTGTDQTSRYDLVDGKCAITVNPPIAASGDLAAQAQALLTQAYAAQGYQVLDDNYGTNLVANRTTGRSAKGWEWVELRAELRKSGPSPERGHLLLVAMGGGQVLPILGYSANNDGCTQLAHDNTAGIVGELRWRQLAHSLELPGVQPATLSVVGQWSLFQGASGQEYVFAANGRYQFWGGLTQAHQVSATEIELVTSTFGGDGFYEVHGDVLSLFPDGRAAESMLFRVFEQHAVSPVGNVTREVKLGLMKQDVGGPYEVAVIKH